MQGARRSKENLAVTLQCSSVQNSVVATTPNSQTTVEKHAKAFKPRKPALNLEKLQPSKAVKKAVIGTWSKNSSIIKKQRTD